MLPLLSKVSKKLIKNIDIGDYVNTGKPIQMSFLFAELQAYNVDQKELLFNIKLITCRQRSKVNKSLSDWYNIVRDVILGLLLELSYVYFVLIVNESVGMPANR